MADDMEGVERLMAGQQPPQDEQLEQQQPAALAIQFLNGQPEAQGLFVGQLPDGATAAARNQAAAAFRASGARVGGTVVQQQRDSHVRVEHALAHRTQHRQLTGASSARGAHTIADSVTLTGVAQPNAQKEKGYTSEELEHKLRAAMGAHGEHAAITIRPAVLTCGGAKPRAGAGEYGGLGNKASTYKIKVEPPPGYADPDGLVISVLTAATGGHLDNMWIFTQDSDGNAFELVTGRPAVALDAPSRLANSGEDLIAYEVTLLDGASLPSGLPYAHACYEVLSQAIRSAADSGSLPTHVLMMLEFEQPLAASRHGPITLQATNCAAPAALQEAGAFRAVGTGGCTLQFTPARPAAGRPELQFALVLRAPLLIGSNRDDITAAVVKLTSLLGRAIKEEHQRRCEQHESGAKDANRAAKYKRMAYDFRPRLMLQASPKAIDELTHEQVMEAVHTARGTRLSQLSGEALTRVLGRSWLCLAYPCADAITAFFGLRAGLGLAHTKLRINLNAVETALSSMSAAGKSEPVKPQQAACPAGGGAAPPQSKEPGQQQLAGVTEGQLAVALARRVPLATARGISEERSDWRAILDPAETITLTPPAEVQPSPARQALADVLASDSDEEGEPPAEPVAAAGQDAAAAGPSGGVTAGGGIGTAGQHTSTSENNKRRRSPTRRHGGGGGAKARARDVAQQIDEAGGPAQPTHR